MINEQIRIHPNLGRDLLLKIGISLVVMVLLGPIKFDLGQELPLTFQSLMVVLLPVVFGWVPGLIAVLLYLMLGAFGLPVFAGGASGSAVFLGDTGGFLLMFVPAALLAGYAASFRYRLEMLAVVIIITLAQFLILIGGLFWMEGVRDEDFNYALQLEAFAPAVLIKSLIGLVIYMIVKRGVDRKK